MTNQRRCGRLGRVRASGDLVHGNGDMFAEVFYRLKAVPINVDYDRLQNMYTYWLQSPCFGVVAEGQEIPFYDVIIETDGGEIIGMSVKESRRWGGSS